MRRMKRRTEYEREKEAKKQKLLEQLGNERLLYLTSTDNNFYELWKTKYSKLVHKESKDVPKELHFKVHKAFLTFLHNCCLFQDLVRLKGKDLLTPVSRILIGRPGTTYKYLNTRLFAVPWPDEEHNITYGTDSIFEACKAFSDLNAFLYSQTNKLITAAKNTEEPPCVRQHSAPEDAIEHKHPDSSETTQEAEQSRVAPYNVTLINYMDPQDMPYLKEEPYFGMGKMAVSWHHDENLVEDSTVAVYNFTCQDRDEEHAEDQDPSTWNVALKIAWDIETPGLSLSLNSGDCYFMLGNINITFVSVRSGIFSYHVGCPPAERPDCKCSVALENCFIHPDTGAASVKSLVMTVLQRAEEIHNEVEFEWLRQFWFQGIDTVSGSDFWLGAMAELEDQWRANGSYDQRSTGRDYKENGTKEILNSVLPSLMERRDLRHEWSLRCRSKLAKSLPPDQAPRCHPYWTDEDPTMPLPFDLSALVFKLEDLAKKNENCL
ncbi:LOW QUALITY PROTEIN: alpha-ketoglutarate-dependent dioxygenase FTO [Bombina bombina]|uniref:LOW QUALITY PROTEIN: alpha-ketoglutarate-dependent dioxygenase FTO n=1 Tax=Bombina bombina TaxID=8345 RepID=UPI00235AD0CD|nr:LOW QUALITY PROTEIN: alpha-ketoglutarate-dependent dioxygenase FTO [Bombina bombina]